MTTKITFAVDEKELEKVVETMPLKFKLRLVRRLEEETKEQRWDELFRRIDKNFSKHPVTEEEITREVAAVRRSKYAQGCA